MLILLPPLTMPSIICFVNKCNLHILHLFTFQFIHTSSPPKHRLNFDLPTPPLLKTNSALKLHILQYFSRKLTPHLSPPSPPIPKITFPDPISNRPQPRLKNFKKNFSKPPYPILPASLSLHLSLPTPRELSPTPYNKKKTSYQPFRLTASPYGFTTVLRGSYASPQNLNIHFGI